MNERIRQLAKEYGLVRWDHDSLSYELKGDIENLYEFAELIVRECVECLKPLSRNHSMVGAAQDTIREHFGVE